MTSDFLAALPAGARADGLAFRVKSPTSLACKIDDRVRSRLLPAAVAAEQLQDVVRCTAVAASPAELVGTARALVNGLAARGWSVRGAEQSYLDEHGQPAQHACKGLHLVVAAERAGVACEVQVHSEESIAAKHDTHRECEIERDDTVARPERARAHAVMVERWARVQTPPGLAELRELGGVALVAKAYPDRYAVGAAAPAGAARAAERAGARDYQERLRAARTTSRGTTRGRDGR
ncbi:hypothetical protein CLV92_11376 [Kineococcus xinjiangensis]|uniref:Uncharacterized protein n=1 Tax=Kineococcus xinjiangensis TaxID=512762 RepID=A0A2S6IEM4_9ACTN|nr:hypothetical protein [Kineococcus xinjiangensis]PPK92647.1 hypothetical protein CLV92_11376 [Kineococcus xinjiangensis]